MNRIFILLVVMSFTHQVGGQNILAQNDSPPFFNEKFKEYKIDSCLDSLLWDIVDNDSANLRFPPNEYFYQLGFSNFGHYRQMVVTPSQWQKKLPKDCKGVIRCGEMFFICMGNFTKDSLFIETENYVDILIRHPSLNSEVDKSQWYDWEKSPTAFVGSFNLCNGVPIDLYVNVGKKLSGYTTAKKLKSPTLK